MIAVSSLATQLAALTEQAATGGPLHLPTLVAFTAPASVNRDTTYADLVICAFTGYSNIVGLVFGTPYIDVTGTAVIAAPGGDFIATSGTPSEIVTGVALVNAGLTTLFYSWIFDTPVPITVAGQGFTFDPIVPYGA
jgi:hypothetical protein